MFVAALGVWLPWPSSGFHTVGASLTLLFLGGNGALGTEVFLTCGTTLL